ncbi:RNA polymerase sigma factor [Streptomyces sp. 16-176A]
MRVVRVAGLALGQGLAPVLLGVAPSAADLGDVAHSVLVRVRTRGVGLEPAHAGTAGAQFPRVRRCPEAPGAPGPLAADDAFLGGRIGGRSLGHHEGAAIRLGVVARVADELAHRGPARTVQRRVAAVADTEVGAVGGEDTRRRNRHVVAIGAVEGRTGDAGRPAARQACRHVPVLGGRLGQGRTGGGLRPGHGQAPVGGVGERALVSAHRIAGESVDRPDGARGHVTAAVGGHRVHPYRLIALVPRPVVRRDRAVGPEDVVPEPHPVAVVVHGRQIHVPDGDDPVALASGQRRGGLRRSRRTQHDGQERHHRRQRAGRSRDQSSLHTAQPQLRSQAPSGAYATPVITRCPRTGSRPFREPVRGHRVKKSAAPPDRHGDRVNGSPGRPDDARVIADSLVRPDLFGELYHRHAAAIHRYAARRLGADAAEDITADTFLTAFRTRSRYDVTRSNAQPWLYGIAANLIGKQRRAEVRSLRALARTGHDPVADTWTDRVDSRVTAQSAQAALAGALAALSVGDRHVLLLVAWADLNYQEVAEALSIPVGTVRSRLNRARRKVRVALGGVDPRLVYDFPEMVRSG